MSLFRYALAVAVVGVIALAVMAWFWPINDDFRSQNPAWNGSEQLSELPGVEALEKLADLPAEAAGTTLIVVPYIAFSLDELAALDGFLEAGGTLIVADDYSYGNQLLEHLGVATRFSGVVLLDPLHSHKNGWLPLVSHFRGDALTEGVASLVFNHATILEGMAAADVLAWSSSFSFLDVDKNGVWSEAESQGPFPVIASQLLAQGHLVIVADPSIFINGMEELGDNLTFIENIASNAPGGLFIDQSHLPPSSLHKAKDVLEVFRDAAVTPAGRLGLVLLSVVVIPLLMWTGKKAISPNGKGDGDDS